MENEGEMEGKEDEAERARFDDEVTIDGVKMDSPIEADLGRAHAIDARSDVEQLRTVLDTHVCIIKQLAERIEYNKESIKKVADMMVKLSEDLDTLDRSNAEAFRAIANMSTEMERYTIEVMHRNFAKNVEFNTLSTTHTHALEILATKAGLDWDGEIYPKACEMAAESLEAAWKEYNQGRRTIPIVEDTQRATIDRVWGLHKASLDKAAKGKVPP